jgi:hypothetical protein
MVVEALLVAIYSTLGSELILIDIGKYCRSSTCLVRIAGPCPTEPFQLVPARPGLSPAGPYQLWCTSPRITTETRPVRNKSRTAAPPLECASSQDKGRRICWLRVHQALYALLHTTVPTKYLKNSKPEQYMHNANCGTVLPRGRSGRVTGLAGGHAHGMWYNSFGLAVPPDSLTAGVYDSALFTSVSRVIFDADRLGRTSYTNTQAAKISCPTVATRSSLLSSFMTQYTTSLSLLVYRCGSTLGMPPFSFYVNR